MNHSFAFIVCVCVCVRARARVRVRVHVRMRMRVRVRACVPVPVPVCQCLFCSSCFLVFSNRVCTLFSTSYLQTLTSARTIHAKTEESAPT